MNWRKQIAMDELKKDKSFAKDNIKMYKNQLKQIDNALEFLEFEIELHEKYGSDYTYNDIEKNLMLKNYSTRKHFNNLKNKIVKNLWESTKISNRNLSHYYDIKTKKLRDKYINGDTYNEKTI
jgi:mRNA-degrading endonuclease YafQ of YafQ-DinJ toxin-antitoxin module